MRLMSQEIDRYKLSLFPICQNCNKIKFDGIPYSCKAYPKKNGIPPKIWNGENVKCPYFEEIKKQIPSVERLVVFLYLILRKRGIRDEEIHRNKDSGSRANEQR